MKSKQKEINRPANSSPVETVVSPQIAPDGKPFDYIDDDGITWIMAACGHRIGSNRFTIGKDKEALCPNCKLSIYFHEIPIVYKDRMPGNLSG